MMGHALADEERRKKMKDYNNSGAWVFLGSVEQKERRRKGNMLGSCELGVTN